MSKASDDIGFAFISFNLKRLISSIGKTGLKEYLASVFSFFLAKTPILGLILRSFGTFGCFRCIFMLNINFALETVSNNKSLSFYGGY
jgi:hypothetical protein